MHEGKILRQAADANAGDALDKALSRIFGGDDDHTSVDERAGERIGPYKLLERIGEGGFGVVYMAQRQGAVERPLALKIIKPGMDTEQVVARFNAERQALAMMDHENIASVFDSGTTDEGRPYFVMELVRGVTITEHCDENQLDVPARLRLFVAVCQAVQHAHQKGIIHRDLKPSNVMVSFRDGESVPKVIDFGIAKAIHRRLTEKTVFTSYGQLMGTPAYMSPEQVEMGQLDVDTRSDVYSLGVLFYELLTGSTPLTKEQCASTSYSEMQRMIREVDPPRPTARLSETGQDTKDISRVRSCDPKRLRQTLRGDLDWIAMKSLEKNRARRYQTANELAADVQRYLHDEPVAARPPSTVYRLQKFASKHRRLIAAVSTFGLMLLAATLISTWLAFLATQAERRATYNEGLANERLVQQRLATQEVKKQRDLAEKLGADVANQLAETDKAAERARSFLYVAHMNLIQQLLRTGDDARILELLNLHRSADGKRDLRGFEWYYAWKLCNRNPWNWPHYAAVTCVAHNPDGNVIATGSSDGSVQLWVTESGQSITSIRGHESTVIDVAFSSDGRTIFSGSDDGTFRRWVFDHDRLNPSGPVLRHSASLRCVAVSHDSAKLASSYGEYGEKGETKIWDLETGDSRTLDGNQSAVLALAFSHDDAKLATGDNAANVHVWDVSSALVVRTLQTGLQKSGRLRFHPSTTCSLLAGVKAPWRFGVKPAGAGDWVNMPERPLIWRFRRMVDDSRRVHRTR